MTYLQDTLTRLVAMEKQCISGSDAVPRGYHWQGSFPYWTNTVTESAIGDDENDSEDYEFRIYTVIARLYVGYLTEGSEGEVEDRLYSYWPLVEDFFNARSGERPDLTSTAYPTSLDYLSPIGLRCTGCRSAVAAQGGVGGGATAASVLLLEVTLEIPFHIALS